MLHDRTLANDGDGICRFAVLQSCALQFLGEPTMVKRSLDLRQQQFEERMKRESRSPSDRSRSAAVVDEALAQREALLNDRESSIVERDAALQRRMSEIDERESSVSQRNATAAQREAAKGASPIDPQFLSLKQMEQMHCMLNLINNII